MLESEFYMWRAVFAFAMADRTMSPGELDLLNAFRASVQFTPQELEVLRDDFLYPHSVEDLYRKISAPEHRHRFCTMVRALAWCDGDLSQQNEAILKRVACLGGEDDSGFLRSSAGDPEVAEYYDLYARNGMHGFYKQPHILEVRA